MNPVLRFLRGERRVELCGAEPQRCVNALTGAAVPFWSVQCVDELHYRLSIFSGDGKRLEEIARRTNCTVERCREGGFPQLLRRLCRRPAFLVFMALALAATFFLQSFVWVIEVEGNETVPTQRILRALTEEGISFGSWCYAIDSRQTKWKLLNRIPQLSWLAVNRSGGKLTVLVTEGDTASSDAPPYKAANLVAVRDSVITDYTILEGMKLCNPGDTVRAGQVLVSGYEDYGLFTRCVCAQGEVYGQTWYSATVVTPSHRQEKRFTGREWTHTSVIFGRKRINLSGNSSISHGSCDKMIDVRELSLPGYRFPVTLERVTYREYELAAVAISPAKAQASLETAWTRQLRLTMIAGKIEDTQVALRRDGENYLLRAASTCNEMIGRLIPIDLPPEGE